jgi:hypothetical protein
MPFHCTTEFASKPLPVNVTVACFPVTTFLGLTSERTGWGLFTLKVTALDVPPPGEGLKTVIWFAALAASAEEGTLAVISVELTRAETSACPFQLTIVADVKPVPLISSVTAAAPAVMFAGLTLAIVGMA